MNRRKVLGALLAIPTVASAKALELEADDVIVVRISGHHPGEAYDRIQGQIEDVTGGRYRVLVVHEDVEITTLRQLVEEKR